MIIITKIQRLSYSELVYPSLHYQDLFLKLDHNTRIPSIVSTSNGMFLRTFVTMFSKQFLFLSLYFALNYSHSSQFSHISQ
jgi:hypothetical protein